MSTLIRERMTDAFVLLAGTLAPSEAREQLAAGDYGVVLDQDDTPAALIVAQDLEQAASRSAPSLLDSTASLPPTVIVGSELQMQDLVESGALTLFDVGARGAVVLGDEGVVGVLPVAVVDKYLGSGEYELPTKPQGPTAAISGTGLGGTHQSPLASVMCVALVDLAGNIVLEPAEVVCVSCGHINRLAFLDKEHMPMCQNPDLPSHTLKIASRSKE